MRRRAGYIPVMSLEAMVFGLPSPPSTHGRERVGWRRRQLLAVGLEEHLARNLAEILDLDLHALLELMERGCPPRHAAMILEPVGAL